MKDLNLKKMATNISFEDKAKIIFADWNRRKETYEKENVISTEEKEAMVHDMRKKKEIGQLNQLTDLYNISNVLVFSIHGEIISLKLAITNIHWFVFAIYLNDQVEDKSKEKIKKKKSNDFLSPIHLDDDIEGTQIMEPNLQLQEFFQSLICANKTLLKTLWMLNYIMNKAAIDFLNNEAKKIIQEAEDQIKYVEDLEGFLNILKVYKKYLDLGLMQKDNFHQANFYDLILDHKNFLRLTDQEIKEAEEQIAEHVTKYN